MSPACHDPRQIRGCRCYWAQPYKRMLRPRWRRFQEQIRVFETLKIKLGGEWMSVCRENQFLRAANFCLLKRSMDLAPGIDCRNIGRNKRSQRS